MKSRIISLIMAVLMFVGCSVNVFADGTANHVITINNEKKGHEYQAYQIFKGDLNVDKTILSNIEWGNGIDGDSMIAMLNEQEDYKDCKTAKEVAEVLTGFGDDSEKLEAFAEMAETCLSGISAGVSVEKEDSYEVSVVGDGYYLIRDEKEPEDGDAYTKFMLKVVKSIEVDVKADAPVFEKYIVEAEERMESNSASVGDTIEYLLVSNVPEMDGYEKYFFIVHDTLDEGLTFQPSSVTISIGGTEISEDAYQVVTDASDTDCTFEIVLKDFVQYKDQEDAEILISYKADVNTDAVVGNTGNANRAYLQYSNNPNVEQIGQDDNPDRPDDGTVTGETPDDITITYLTGIELFKVDDSEDALPLTGAEFTITGEKLNQVKTVSGVYTEDVNGIYYKLKDGTYTDVSPVDDTLDRYESAGKLYSLTTETEWVTVEEEIGATATVDISGQLCFHGLAEGTYTIEEITAPNGYNLLEEPFTVEITMMAPENVDTGEESTVWKYTVDGAFAQSETTAESGIVTLSVVNKAGSLLPTTGGNGIYVFYVIGICLVIAAWIADRRKNRKNEI